MNSLVLGTLGGLISCLSTCLGALPSLYKKDSPSNPWKFVSLDFTLGMMLSASAFSLIMPAYKGVALQNVLLVSLTIIGGGVFLQIFEKILQKEEKSSRAWLFVTAMMIHNFPEGLASGASLNVDNIKAGILILGSISLQNLPEGLMTALAFQSLGMGPKKALLGAFVTGFMELSGGFVGGALTSFTAASLPYMLAFAGGAMLWVSTKEIIAHSKEQHKLLVFNKAFVVGFALMFTLSLF